MKTHHVVHIAFLAVVVAAPPLQATMVETTTVRLARTDRTEVERVACHEPHGLRLDRLEAYTYDNSLPLVINVEAYCEPHGDVLNSPIRYAVSCGNSTGKWSCDAKLLEVLVTIGDHVVAVRPGEISVDEAVRITQDTAANGWFQGRSLANEILTSTCSISPSRPEAWSVRCDLWDITVIHWCADGPCQYKVIGLALWVP